MAKKPKVKSEGGIHWLTPALAASAAGLSRPELARRISEHALRVQYGEDGTPQWYAEPDIHELRKARGAIAAKRATPKPRTKTAAQLEREWAKISEDNRDRYRGGVVSAHYEKVLLAEIALNAEKAKSRKGG